MPGKATPKPVQGFTIPTRSPHQDMFDQFEITHDRISRALDFIRLTEGLTRMEYINCNPQNERVSLDRDALATFLNHLMEELDLVKEGALRLHTSFSKALKENSHD